MSEYVLIVIIKYYDSTSTISHDFSSKAKCEYAKAKIEYNKVISRKNIVVCVPK